MNTNNKELLKPSMEDRIVKPSNKKEQRVFSKLGYSKLETAELVDTMNKLLANFSVHYQKLRNFHWNVKGPDFFDVHEKFEEQYNYAKTSIDEIAERIRVFGQTPLSNMSEYLDNSDIKEARTNLKSHEMVKEIISDYEILLEHFQKVIEVAIENSDNGTEDMMKGFVKQIEKNHWMLSAFSQK